MTTTHRLAQILRNLENSPSLTDKMTILQDNGETLPAFREMLVYALDPYKKYGFKTLPAPAKDGKTLAFDPNSWTYLTRVFDSLINSGKNTNEMKTKLGQLLGQLDGPTKLVVQRVILKDLRCGVGATLVNKVLPGLIPEFGVMLATPLEERHIKKLLQQKVYAQAKKNGDRCIVICDDTPAAYSRRGHLQPNYQHIVDACVALCHDLGKQYVFDGEVINGDFWGTRTVKKKAGNNADNAKLHVFDIVPLDQWVSGHTSPFSERRRTLKRVFHNYPKDGALIRIPSHVIQVGEATWDNLVEWRNNFMEQGEEGLILRLDVPYNFKTRSSLFKFKDMKEGDFTIVDVLQGEEDKKYANVAAKVVVDIGNGDTCEVGIKGDMNFRHHFLKSKKRYIGMVCEVHYQDWTENEAGKPALQFGVMHRIREDKS